MPRAPHALLVRAHQERRHQVGLALARRVQRQERRGCASLGVGENVFDAFGGGADKGVDAPVAVAGEVRHRPGGVRSLAQAVQRRHREQLLDGPYVRQGAEHAHVGVVPHRGPTRLRLHVHGEKVFGGALFQTSLARDVKHARARQTKELLRLGSFFQPHDPELEQPVGFLPELRRVVDRLLHVRRLRRLQVSRHLAEVVQQKPRRRHRAKRLQGGRLGFLVFFFCKRITTVRRERFSNRLRPACAFVPLSGPPSASRVRGYDLEHQRGGRGDDGSAGLRHDGRRFDPGARARVGERGDDVVCVIFFVVVSRSASAPPARAVVVHAEPPPHVYQSHGRAQPHELGVHLARLAHRLLDGGDVRHLAADVEV
mmetsp:Transcript_6837/g.27943  ORF Transcript_6837/g.27943 Transcript_6837/m.27943 type:complete len:370 (-) Transcript_6837:1144-2253(-)